MNRYNKIIVCAVLITALFICSALSSFAYGEKSDDYVFTYSFGGIGNPDYIVGQRNVNNPSDVKEYSFTAENNVSAGLFDYKQAGLTLSDKDGGFRSAPLICEPFYNFTAPYNKSGYLIAQKGLNLYDLAYIDSYAISIDFLCAVGMQDYTGIDMDRVRNNAFQFRFSDGSYFNEGKFEIIQEVDLHRYMHYTDVGDVATEVPYDLKVLHIRYNFDEPFHLSDLKDTSLNLVYSFNWQGLPPHYIRTFCAISPFYVDYVTADNIDIYVELLDDEEAQKDLAEAEKVVEEKREQVADIIDKLDSPKPSDGDVDSLLDNIDVDSITVVGDFISFTDNSDSLFSRFIVTVSVSVLGVAFIGYVLHGKRG